MRLQSSGTVLWASVNLIDRHRLSRASHLALQRPTKPVPGPFPVAWATKIPNDVRELKHLRIQRKKSQRVLRLEMLSRVVTPNEVASERFATTRLKISHHFDQELLNCMRVVFPIARCKDVRSGSLVAPPKGVTRNIRDTAGGLSFITRCLDCALAIPTTAVTTFNNRGKVRAIHHALAIWLHRHFASHRQRPVFCVPRLLN